MNAQAQIITSAIMQEITDDAIEPIWDKAKKWYANQHVYSGFGRTIGSVLYSVEFVDSSPNTSCISLPIRRFTLAYWMDAALIASVGGSLVFNALGFWGAFGAAAISLLYTLVISGVNSKAYENNKPALMPLLIVNMVYHWRINALLNREYTQKEKITLCAAYLRESADQDSEAIKKLTCHNKLLEEEHQGDISKIKSAVQQNRNGDQTKFMAEKVLALEDARKQASQQLGTQLESLRTQASHKRALASTLGALSVLLNRFEEQEGNTLISLPQTNIDNQVLQETNDRLASNTKQIQKALDEVYTT